MAPWIFVDDVDTFMTFLGSWNQQVRDPQMLGGSYATPDPPVQPGGLYADKPTISYTSDGTQLDIYGYAPAGASLNVTIDSGQPKPIDLINAGNSTGKSSLIASVPLLGTGDHSIRVGVNTGAPYIDYMLVTPRASSTLVSRNLLADDRDPYLKYSGSWKQDSGPSADYGTSLNNTRTGSKTKGDKVTVDFYGGSIGVYGLLNPTDGILSASFSIDGKPAAQFTPYDGTQTVNSSKWLINQQFFYQDLSSSSSQHTLTINVNQVTGSQMLWLDYITFEGGAFTDLDPPVPDTEPSIPKSVSLAFLPGVIIGGICVLIAFVIIYRVCRGKGVIMVRTNFGARAIYRVRPAAPPPAPAPEPQPQVSQPAFSQGGLYTYSKGGSDTSYSPALTAQPSLSAFPSPPSPSPGLGPGYVGGFTVPPHFEQQQPLLYNRTPSPGVTAHNTGSSGVFLGQQNTGPGSSAGGSSAIFVTNTNGELTLVAPGASGAYAGQGAYNPDVKADPSLFTQPSGTSTCQDASVQQLQHQIEQLRMENERIRLSGNPAAGGSGVQISHGHSSSIGGPGEGLPPPPYQPEGPLS
ncbi:hypothetical protein BDN72DRAFT_381207 [Pluteus cervinus]|uniref:Uncharacterized protein n=1 Tax=Pluteus cervinus TaxID=181527 RepID=A0ACD3B262_9AGAR|nr:hypothetical protein BDN72DRAFT_381207 [Pluteus cervinus]